MATNEGPFVVSMLFQVDGRPTYFKEVSSKAEMEYDVIKNEISQAN